LKELAATNQTTINNKSVAVKSVQLRDDLNKGKNFTSENEKIQAMLPDEKKQVFSTGKVFGVGESFAKRLGQCNVGTECGYSFRTALGSVLDKTPSLIKLEVKEIEARKRPDRGAPLPQKPTRPTPMKPGEQSKAPEEGPNREADNEKLNFIREKKKESERLSDPNGFDSPDPQDRSIKIDQYLIPFESLAGVISNNRDFIIGKKQIITYDLQGNKEPKKRWVVNLIAEGGLDKIREIYKARQKDIGFDGIVLTDLSENDDKIMSSTFALYGENKEPLMEIVFKEKDDKPEIKTDAGPTERSARAALGLPAAGALTREQINQAFKDRTLEARNKPGEAGTGIDKLKAARDALHKVAGG
jgi:hypothetical protein